MVPEDDLSDEGLNQLCCQRLGWELRPHLWEFGSVWHEKAWFKGETLIGFPNFLVQDPFPAQLKDHLELHGLQDRFAQILFDQLNGQTLSHLELWYRMAHVTPRERLHAFLKATETF